MLELLLWKGWGGREKGWETFREQGVRRVKGGLRNNVRRFSGRRSIAR